MELEGFGTSLVGRCIYVNAEESEAWIPWEFIQANYNAKILIRTNSISSVLLSNSWTIVFEPGTDTKVWSAIATMLKSLGNTILLVFSGGPVPPSSFLSFLDHLILDGRIVITRIYCGTNGLNEIPEAIFFPYEAPEIYETCKRLPNIRGHNAWNGVSNDEFKNLLQAVISNKVGIMITDVEESSWKLFWHRIEDSRSSDAKKILPSLLQCALKLCN
jgi:hypothetical protein